MVGGIAVAGVGIVGTVDAEAVAQGRVESLHLDVPDLAGAVDGGIELDLGQLGAAAGFEEHQGDAGGVAGKDGEVDAVREHGGPQRGG